MSTLGSFSAGQIEALASMRDVLASERWSLIGASAIHCRLPLPRHTADVDFVVVASSELVEQRMRQAGWNRHPRLLQRWTRAGIAADVVPTSDEDLLAGVTVLGDGFVMSVIGLDLAFVETDPIVIREKLSVPVPRLPVLLLLKMVAWLDRPYERQKDLSDIVFIWDNALPPDDDRRWDPDQPVGAAGLDYEDQSPFFCGWQLGTIGQPQHLHWVKRFAELMRDSDSIHFAQLVRASRYVGDDVETRLQARLFAFERGLEIGSVPAPAPTSPIAPMPRQPIAPTPQHARAPSGWGGSRSLQMLLHDAIDRRRVIRFHYRGRLRVAEPHVLGIKDGRLAVLTWQTGGSSSSGSLPDWRRFQIDDIANLEITNEAFAGPRLSPGRHTAFDRQIVVVR